MEEHGDGAVVMPGCNGVAAVGMGVDGFGPSFDADRVHCLDGVDEDGGHPNGWSPWVAPGCDGDGTGCFHIQAVPDVVGCDCYAGAGAV